MVVRVMVVHVHPDLTEKKHQQGKGKETNDQTRTIL